MPTIFASQPTSRGSSIVGSFLTFMLMTVALPAHAQKTISYYTDNVIERIDKVLACKDGADEPTSLGCRNANAAQQLDIQLAGRFQRRVSLTKWSAENDPKNRESRVLLAIESISNTVTSASCINLTEGSVPTNQIGKSSLKVALDEKLLEPQPAQPGKYRTTARGEAFLFAQQRTSKSGYFCPTTFQFLPEFKIVDFKDLTAQYKGKKSESGRTIKTLALATVEMPLINTSASVWFSKKIYPKSLPATGQAVGRYYIIEYVNEKGTVGFGRIGSIDGVTISETKVEEIFDKGYK